MEVADQIREVSTRNLPTGVLIYVVELANGNQYTTRDRSLGQLASSNLGQTAHIDYDEQKRGQYTNRFINTLTLIDTPAGNGGGREERPAGLFDDAAPEAIVAVVSTDKDLQIAKAVALKAAVDVMQYLPTEQRTVANIEIAAEHFTRWLVTWRP
jgi:hypothetical protein